MIKDISYAHLTVVRPNVLLANLLNLDLLTCGGLSHSSTYGCQNSGPLPRDTIVCSYALLRATRMLRERKKYRMEVAWLEIKTNVASNDRVNGMSEVEYAALAYR